MFTRVPSIVAIAVGFLFLAGCGPAKLEVAKSYELEPGMVQGFYLDKQSKPQKVTITFTSSEGEVEVLLFKSEDAPDEKVINVESAKALGSKTSKGETFTVDVPENTEARFVIRGAKTMTKVDVKVTN